MAFSIIIPSKSAANLVPCVQAIREAGETCTVIIVDDGIEWRTGDHKTAALDVSAWPFNVIEGVKPFCFARNVNLGIVAAGSDDVIILNDDALLKSPRGFTLMAEAAKANPEYGMLAAACDTTGNPNQCNFGSAGIRFEPRMVCFVCVYIPRSTVNTVGLLDTRFVDYGLDDDDYSFRVRAAGLKLGIFDGCFVDHASLKSSYRHDPLKGGDFSKNMTRFIEKWGTDNWNRKYEQSEFKNLWPKVGA